MSKQPCKPIKWVGSAKRDLDAMPEDVKDVFGLPSTWHRPAASTRTPR
jgi:hypothetical protein